MTMTIEQLDIAPMERFGMYAYLGLVRVMEPETETLMQELAQHSLVSDEYDSPHSRPWFVSFHGSEFPGVPESACQRYLTYRMMNFPSASGPMPPWVTTTGTVGKAGELDIVKAWFHGGRALAIPEDDAAEAERYRKVAEYLVAGGSYERGREMIEAAGIHQLGFVDEAHWMTVSTDLPILPRGWRRPHIVEIKCKADDVLDEMLEGRLLLKQDGTMERVGRGPDERHTVQLRATIGKANDYDWGEVGVCKQCWFVTRSDVYERLGLPGGVHPRSDAYGYCPRCEDYAGTEVFHLDPPTTGEIYYWSRSWPRKTKSFFFEHDPSFMANGMAVLRQARQAYIDDRLPERPAHFQWGVGPCQNCDFKPFCRADSGVPGRLRKPRPELIRTRLTESHGVESTRSLRPKYDPEAVRARVFQEWGHGDA